MRRILVDLNSQKVLYLFVLFLTLGAVSIYATFLLPALPILLLICYGAVLFLSSSRYLVIHSDVTKNSPYFLAFSYFLISLYVVFQRSDLQRATAYPEILSQLGAALLPTVAGLVIRHALFAWDPASKHQEALYRSVEDDLRRNVAAFKQAQQRLTDLARDFADAHADLLAREQQASRSYISSFEEATATFTSATAKYPKAIDRALDRLASRISPTIDRLDSLLSSLEAFDAEAPKAVSDHLRGLVANLAEVRQGLTEVGGSAETLGRSFESLPAKVSRNIDEISGRLSSTLTSVDKRFSDSTGSVVADLERTQRELSAFVKGLHGELSEIDTTVGQLVDLLENRINSLRPRSIGHAAG